MEMKILNTKILDLDEAEVKENNPPPQTTYAKKLRNSAR
jgi:hypothetical protein